MKAALPVLAPLLFGALALSACVPSATAPAPAPASAPAVITAPAAPIAALPRVVPIVLPDWEDMPATPGEWRYSAHGASSEATFSGRSDRPLTRLSCNPESSAVILTLPQVVVRGLQLTIQSETMSRTVPLIAAEGGAYVIIPQGDPLLDAMALSKGRFAVQATGTPPLILPSWVEVSRVIEDCR